MKKIIRFIPIAFLLCLCGLLKAQQLTQAEYFLDTDPGVGNGTTIPVGVAADSLNLTFTAPLNSVSSGFHRLFARFKDSQGHWGLYQGATFYVLSSSYDTASSPQISAAEYFIDTDPGTGHGTPITVSAGDSVNTIFNVSLNSLSAGFHHIYSRFKYTSGIWGDYEGSTFYVVPPGAVSNSPQINYAEYFFDTDPGVGNGTPVGVPATDSANIVVNVPVTGLGHGPHELYFRFRYTNGVWGLYQSGGTEGEFTVCNAPTDTTTASGPTTYCYGGSVTLNSNTGNTWHYQWQRNGNNLAGDTLSTLVVNNSSGVYDVLITDTGNCPGTSNSITVTVNGSVTNMYDTICSGNSFAFNGQSLTAPGTYSDTTQVAGGCDSIVILALTVDTVVASFSWDSLAYDGIVDPDINHLDTAWWCYRGGPNGQFHLAGGSPLGGTYTGNGIFENVFYGDSINFNFDLQLDTVTYIVSLNGCNASASNILAVLLCEGINSLSLEESISLYPNPAMDRVVLQSALFSTKYVTPVLYDITGKEIAASGFTRQKEEIIFNTNSLSAGIYFIKVNIDGNQAVKKFVKVE